MRRFLYLFFTLVLSSSLSVAEERKGSVVGTLKDLFVGEINPFILGEICLLSVDLTFQKKKCSDKDARKGNCGQYNKTLGLVGDFDNCDYESMVGNTVSIKREDIVDIETGVLKGDHYTEGRIIQTDQDRRRRGIDNAKESERRGYYESVIETLKDFNPELHYYFIEDSNAVSQAKKVRAKIVKVEMSKTSEECILYVTAGDDGDQLGILTTPFKCHMKSSGYNKIIDPGQTIEYNQAALEYLHSYKKIRELRKKNKNYFYMALKDYESFTVLK